MAAQRSKWKPDLSLLVGREVWCWWRATPGGKAVMCKLLEMGSRWQVYCDDLPRIRGPRFADEMGGEWLEIKRPKPD